MILEIDGKKIEGIIKEKEKYVPPTNRNYHNHWLFTFLLRTNNSQMKLAIERSGNNLKTEIECVNDPDIFKSIVLEEDEAESHKFITKDIGYIRPSKLREDEAEEVIEKFKDTKGVIIDDRYYPSSVGVWYFVEDAMPNVRECAKFSKPSIKHPGNVMTCYTGIGVYYPDGRETQRVGINPDIEVRPTIEGLRQGRDELIERAVEVINNGI